jgi:predicted ATPase
MTCHIWDAFVLWHLGYPDQALQRTHEAITLAREFSHPYSLATALGRAAMFFHHRREGQAVQALTGEMMALATEQGFPYLAMQGGILQGWAVAEQGQEEEGLPRIRQGLAAYQATGSEVLRSYFLALLAEAYGKAGQAEEGLSTLAEALAVVGKSGERFYEAELYRLKGQLTLQSKVPSPKPALSLVEGSQVEETLPGRVGIAHQDVSLAEAGAVGGAHPTREAEAEECFWKALEIARKQRAKSLELRATMSLARLWQQQRKKQEARQMLAEIYGWFTEGFDTADLQEAKALLDES